MNVMWYDDFENVICTLEDVGGYDVAKFHTELLQYFNIYRINVANLYTIHVNLIYHIHLIILSRYEIQTIMFNFKILI